MPTFSKFITGRRGSQQLVDSDGYIYSRKKDKDSALKSAWRCSKHCIPTKCPCLCYLTLSDNTLTLSKKTHTHEADIAAPERQEALVETSPAVNQILPNIMSLARVIQRSRAVASGSSQHQEATTSEDFTLPISSLFPKSTDGSHH